MSYAHTNESRNFIGCHNEETELARLSHKNIRETPTHESTWPHRRTVAPESFLITLSCDVTHCMTPSPALLLLSSSPLSHPRSTLTRRRRRPAFRHYIREREHREVERSAAAPKKASSKFCNIFAMIISSPMKKGGLGAEVDLCYRRSNTLSSLWKCIAVIVAAAANVHAP